MEPSIAFSTGAIQWRGRAASPGGVPPRPRGAAPPEGRRRREGAEPGGAAIGVAAEMDVIVDVVAPPRDVVREEPGHEKRHVPCELQKPEATGSLARGGP